MLAVDIQLRFAYETNMNDRWLKIVGLYVDFNSDFYCHVNCTSMEIACNQCHEKMEMNNWGTVRCTRDVGQFPCSIFFYAN